MGKYSGKYCGSAFRSDHHVPRKENRYPLKSVTRLDFSLGDKRVLGYALLQGIKGSEWAAVPDRANLGKTPGLSAAEAALSQTTIKLKVACQSSPRFDQGRMWFCFCLLATRGFLWLGSDRYGLNLYYYHNKNEFAFSTNLSG